MIASVTVDSRTSVTPETTMDKRHRFKLLGTTADVIRPKVVSPCNKAPGLSDPVPRCIGVSRNLE